MHALDRGETAEGQREEGKLGPVRGLSRPQGPERHFDPLPVDFEFPFAHFRILRLAQHGLVVEDQQRDGRGE